MLLYIWLVWNSHFQTRDCKCCSDSGYSRVQGFSCTGLVVDNSARIQLCWSSSWQGDILLRSRISGVTVVTCRISCRAYWWKQRTLKLVASTLAPVPPSLPYFCSPRSKFLSTSWFVYLSGGKSGYIFYCLFKNYKLLIKLILHICDYSPNRTI